jgi:plastocyanin
LTFWLFNGGIVADPQDGFSVEGKSLMKANQYLVMVFLFATVESLASPQEGSSSRNTDPLFGSAAEDQTVTIDLGERSFDQQELSVVAGQTVRMLFNNPGNQPHRIVIGHDLVKFWSQNGLSDERHPQMSFRRVMADILMNFQSQRTRGRLWSRRWKSFQP